jgi:hypothetical protein
VAQLADKCIDWFQTTLSQARELGAAALEGQAMLGLGQAWAMMNRSDQAADMLNLSIDIFSRLNATSHLEQARTVIESLSSGNFRIRFP